MRRLHNDDSDDVNNDADEEMLEDDDKNNFDDKNDEDDKNDVDDDDDDDDEDGLAYPSSFLNMNIPGGLSSLLPPNMQVNKQTVIEKKKF